MASLLRPIRFGISDGYKIDDNPDDEGKEDTQSLDKGDSKTEFEDFVAPEYPGVGFRPVQLTRVRARCSAWE